MDDGSHIVQFDAYVDKASAAIHGWLDPSIETAAYFIIYPLRISSRLLHIRSIAMGGRRRSKRPQRHALPTAWRSVSGEEKGSRVPAGAQRCLCTGDKTKPHAL